MCFPPQAFYTLARDVMTRLNRKMVSSQSVGLGGIGGVRTCVSDTSSSSCSSCRMTAPPPVEEVLLKSQSLALKKASSGVHCFRLSLHLHGENNTPVVICTPSSFSLVVVRWAGAGH